MAIRRPDGPCGSCGCIFERFFPHYEGYDMIDENVDEMENIPEAIKKFLKYQ